MNSGASLHSAPAKLNLALAITGRRDDGYHGIDTVMVAITFADELRVEATGGRDLELSVVAEPASGVGGLPILEAVPGDDRNLVARAWRRLADRFPERDLGARIELRKRIPPGAGLGGGSSDAATALRAMNAIFDLGMSRSELSSEAAELGSDVPFFLEATGLARARGRGEIVEPLGFAPPPIPLVVVRPAFESPTAAAYRGLAPADFESPARAAERVERVVEALRADDRDALSRATFNAFERSLRERDPRYDETLQDLREAGLSIPRITGSGSACFGLAKDAEHAEAAARALGRRHPFARAACLGVFR